MVPLSCSRAAGVGLSIARVAVRRPPWGLSAAARLEKRHTTRSLAGRQPGTGGGADDGAREQGHRVVAPWEKPPAEGDGNDELRQRAREHTPLGAEERQRRLHQKLGLVQQELREDEVRALQRFEDCEKDGDLLAQDVAHSRWKRVCDLQDLLQQDQGEFVRIYGTVYGIPQEAAVEATAATAAALSTGAAAANQQPGGGTGLAPVRQRLEGFTLPKTSTVAKLQKARESLRESELQHQETFELYSTTGDLEGQARVHKQWQETREQLDLLERLPWLFIGQQGYWHGFGFWTLLLYSIVKVVVIYIVTTIVTYGLLSFCLLCFSMVTG